MSLVGEAGVGILAGVASGGVIRVTLTGWRRAARCIWWRFVVALGRNSGDGGATKVTVSLVGEAGVGILAGVASGGVIRVTLTGWRRAARCIWWRFVVALGRNSGDGGATKVTVSLVGEAGVGILAGVASCGVIRSCLIVPVAEKSANRGALLDPHLFEKLKKHNRWRLRSTTLL